MNTNEQNEVIRDKNIRTIIVSSTIRKMVPNKLGNKITKKMDNIIQNKEHCRRIGNILELRRAGIYRRV